jgi:hypothetical protein
MAIYVYGYAPDISNELRDGASGGCRELRKADITCNGYGYLDLLFSLKDMHKKN